MGDMRMSAAGRAKLTEPWEEKVDYVYDDKRPKEHGRYLEWDGGPVRGTLTIGYGHTDAAGSPKIQQGMRLEPGQADEILSKDMADCEEAVNRLFKVEPTQHQFDAMCDTYFNCPAAAAAAIKLINAGETDKVPAKLLQYVYSKGEHMEGLVHRRNAEIAWFNHPDDVEPPPAPNPDIVFSPKAERNPPPKSILASKAAAAAASILSLSLAEITQKINDLLSQANQIKGQLDQLGIGGSLSQATHDPVLLLGVVACGLAAFIIYDRHSKLVNEHV